MNIETTIQVEGMTCSSCEGRIEKALTALPGVTGAKASQLRGRVLVMHAEGVGAEALKAAIEGAGYATRERPSRATALALGIGLLLAAAYLLASAAGLFNNFPLVETGAYSFTSYAMLVVIGLLTSVRCVAMCGGLVISQSLGRGPAPALESGRAGPSPDRLRPGLLYNSGRLVSYTLVGGLVGSLGSVFAFSETAKGLITGLAGFFMLWLGLSMFGLLPSLPSLPGLSRLSSGLPAPLRRFGAKVSARLAGRGPFAVGLLGGLMPCGPLQTMQLYALGTGSAVAGALSMFLFALGTLPLLLVFGAAASLIPRRLMPVMIKAGAVLVLPPNPARISVEKIGMPTIRKGAQEIVVTVDASGYSPAALVLQKGMRAVIRFVPKGLDACNSYVDFPAYHGGLDLAKGELSTP